MRKQELIQLHKLSFRLAQQLTETDDLPATHFDEYLSQSTRPISLSHSKTDHQAALQLLMDSLTEIVASKQAKDADEVEQSEELVSPPT